MRPQSLDDFLRKSRIPYTTFRHSPAFTAQHAAAVSHVPGRCWAKTVVFLAGDEPILAVVPAHYTVDVEMLRLLANAGALRLATPQELVALYSRLRGRRDAAVRRPVPSTRVRGPESGRRARNRFSSGNARRCIRMHYGDFADIAHPTVGVFGSPCRGEGPAPPPMMSS